LSVLVARTGGRVSPVVYIGLVPVSVSISRNVYAAVGLGVRVEIGAGAAKQ
jgi:hypothetical protein